MELSFCRAMSFWTYQTAQLSYVDFSLDIRAPASTQAIFYLRNSAFQEYVVNQAKERVHGLEAQLHQGQPESSDMVVHTSR